MWKGRGSKIAKKTTWFVYRTLFASWKRLGRAGYVALGDASLVATTDSTARADTRNAIG